MEGLQIMANVLEIARASITAFNEKDWNRIRALYAPDAVYDEKATNRRIQGPDQIIEALKGWATAFPDAKGTIVRELATADTAALEIVWKATHTGPLQTPSGTIPASNRVAELPACSVMLIEGEKVKYDTHYFDLLTLLTQIGAAGMSPGQSRAA
jgi:steroid delta-isomerase-like uncharacterized protein